MHKLTTYIEINEKDNIQQGISQNKTKMANKHKAKCQVSIVIQKCS